MLKECGSTTGHGCETMGQIAHPVWGETHHNHGMCRRSFDGEIVVEKTESSRIYLEEDGIRCRHTVVTRGKILNDMALMRRHRAEDASMATMYSGPRGLKSRDFDCVKE